MCDCSPAGCDGKLVFILVVGDSYDTAAIFVNHAQTLELGCTRISLSKAFFGMKEHTPMTVAELEVEAFSMVSGYPLEERRLVTVKRVDDAVVDSPVRRS